MKLTITNFLLFLPFLGGIGCGSVLSDQQISIEMYGVSKAPASAVGDRDPHFLSYQLLAVNLTSEDGTTTTTLFDNEEDRIYRIVDRSQIIYSKKITDLVGNSYASLKMTFAPLVEGGERGGEELSFTMSNPELLLAQPFAVSTAKDLSFLIKIDWGNTLSDEALTEPEYQISIE